MQRQEIDHSEEEREEKKFKKIIDEYGSIESYNISIPSESYEYTGSSITPKVTISGLTENIDYTVEYLNNIEIGTATINVRGINNYTGETSTIFTINYS